MSASLLSSSSSFVPRSGDLPAPTSDRPCRWLQPCCPCLSTCCIQSLCRATPAGTPRPPKPRPPLRRRKLPSRATDRVFDLRARVSVDGHVQDPIPDEEDDRQRLPRNVCRAHFPSSILRFLAVDRVHQRMAQI